MRTALSFLRPRTCVASLCVALTVAATGCEINTKIDANGSVKGSVDGKGTGGGSGGDTSATITEGAVLLGASDGSCGNVWAITGEVQSCEDCDVAFDIDLEARTSDCFDVGDLSGDLEIRDGAAIFNGYYWGAAFADDGQVVWYTYEHLDGPYYSYYYYGYIYY